MALDSVKSRGWLIILLVLGAAAALLMLWLTPRGIGLYYDSMAYMEAADNLLAGLGLGRVTCEAFKPLTRYPPLYSLLLAAVHALGFTMADGARYISAGAMGAVTLLVGANAGRGAGRPWPALVGSGLVIVSVPVMRVFSWAMSEPLYMALWLGSTLALDDFLATARRRQLLGAAALSAMAILTRYVGVLPILSNSAVLLVQALRGKLRWREVGVYMAIAFGPMLLWLARGIIVAGNPTSREAVLHLVTRKALRGGADTIIDWFGPASSLSSEEEVATILAGLVVILVLPLLSVVCRRTPNAGGSRLAKLHVLASMAYVCGVLLSISLFDEHTPLDDRILIPTYVSLIVVLLIVGAEGIKRRSVLTAGAALLVLLSLGVRQISQFEGAVTLLREDGQGYAAKRRVESAVASRLREIRPAPIYTNDITAVFFLIGAPSCAIPTKTDEASLLAMRDRLKTEGAALAIFGALSREYMPLDRLTEGLVPLEVLNDGAIYVAASLESPHVPVGE